MRKSLLAAASASFMLMGGINASAGMFRPYPAMPQGGKTGFHNAMQRSPGSFLPKGVGADGIMTPDYVLDATHKKEMDPVGALLGPTGEHWFYTIETTGEKLVENPYNTTWNFDTFKLTVYDGKMNIVGYAHGKANFPEGAKRCQSIVPALQITGNFFNSNSSDYEVMMTLNFNPDDSKYLYGAKQMTQVYTLQPTMPEEPQKPVFEVPGQNSGVINGSTTMTEGWVMSFTYHTTWDNEVEEQNKATLRVYKPAGWGTPPELIAQQKSYIVPGGGSNESNPFFIAVHGNDIYSVHTYYEYPWLEEGSDDVPTMRPDNNFIIELYKPTSKEPINFDDTDPGAVKPKPYKTVTIPCGNPSSEEYIWREYALGNFSGHTDVTWDFSEGNDPCFIITILDSNVQEEESHFYEIYDIDGKKIKEFGQKSAGYQMFSSVEGYPEQWGFDVLNEEGTTVTQLMNWPSLEIVGEIPTLFEYEGNIFSLSSVPDRVPGDGGMLYAANAVPTMGETESAFAYIAYFRPDGQLHHMDELRLPENTAKAYAFIQTDVLDPYLFNTDKNYEYLLWHYTWKDEGQIGTDLSLAVVDNKGRILAKRVLTDGHSHETAFVSNCPDQRYIVMIWRDASSWDNNDQMEFISLPLNKFEGEGTVENPYLIRTWGDFDQIRNNLTGHFALAGNVDCENRAFRPIEGAFVGSIDGRGNALRNLYVSAENKGALFMEVGSRPEDDAETPAATIKNLIISGATLNHAGSSLGTKQYGLLVHTARYAEFNKVHVVDAKVDIAGVNVEFGTLAHTSDNSSFIDCAVKDADYKLERGNGIGGIVFDARQSVLRGNFVSGNISGRQTIGGIAGRTNLDVSTLTDNHVKADITCSLQAAGGILGNNISRSLVKNNIVEGSMTGSSSIGGVIGSMPAASDYDAFDVIVEGNVVALDEFNVGEKPEAVHRIVGYSSIDEGPRQQWVDNPDWNPEDPNSPSGSYETIPAEHETKIGVNHVLGGIPAVDGSEGLATEGVSTDIYDTDREFFEGLGFKFGSDSENPWVISYISPMPKLYYEDMIGATIQFSAGVYEGAVDSSIIVVVIGEGFDIFEAAGSGMIEVASSNPSVAEWGYDMVPVEEYPANGVGLPFNLGKAEGEAEITVSYKGLTATAKIVVRDSSGIESAVAGNAVIAYADGIIVADGCAIEVYDAQGRRMASGFGELATTELAAGIYIVRAASESGAATMKIMVK